MKMLTMRLAAMLAGLLVAACGGGGGQDDGVTGEGPVVPQADYFPLAEGNRWLWSSQTAGQTRARVGAQRSVDGLAAWTLVTDEDSGTSTRYLAASASSLRVLRDEQDSIDILVGAYDLLRYPMRVGDRFTQLDRKLSIDVDGDLRADAVQLRSEVTVDGIETITTPIGTLSGVLHLRTRAVTTVTLAGNAGRGEATVVQDDWYAPGIGPVRTDVATTGTGLEPQSDSRVLVGYSVNGRRSDATPPALRSRHPAPLSVRPPSSFLRVTFDKDMDTYSLRQSGLRAVRSDGSAVRGRLEWTARTLSFLPEENLGPGAYTMQASAPWLDVAGNALPEPLRWAFDISNDAWPVASLSPLPMADEVALNSRIVITFDDEPDPSSLTYAITLGDGSGYVDASMQVTGRTVTLTPATPLQRIRTYAVNVGSQARDRHGNPLVQPFGFYFTGDSGAFRAGKRLYESDSSTVKNATADVNGDGRIDLLTLATLRDTSGPLLYLLTQQPGGTLAPPVRIPHAVPPRFGSACAAVDMVPKDMNRDGRLDLVVATNYCGVDVMLQSAQGAFVSTHFAEKIGTYRVFAADVDGDGEADPIALTPSGFTWWRGRGNAAPLPGGDVAFSQYIYEAAVADLNGDGRTDFVILQNSFPYFNVVWRLQAADGSFGPEQSVAVHNGAFGGTMAVGDVSGDGRVDIVVTREGNSPTSIFVLKQRADGSFGDVEQLPSYDIPEAVMLSDVSGDGLLDIVVGHSVWSRVGVYFGGPGGSIGSELLYVAEYQDYAAGTLAAGDLNGDGRVDIVAGKEVLLQKTPAVAVSAAAVPLAAAPVTATAAPLASRTAPSTSLRRLIRSAVIGRRTPPTND